MELSGTTRQVQALVLTTLSFVNFQGKLIGTLWNLLVCEASLFGLLCAWRRVRILCQHTFWHAWWDHLVEIKMPEIGDVMDVTVDDLSPEQLQQLKDATYQFQMKCLMLFKKNRSGVPYLKSEMPRVLLPGESDATSFQENEEVLQAFRDTAETVMGRHHRTFLGMFKQMMIGVFGPGMEKVFSRVSPHGYYTEIGETSSAQPTGAQPPL
jgi:hypothetical protein